MKKRNYRYRLNVPAERYPHNQTRIKVKLDTRSKSTVLQGHFILDVKPLPQPALVLRHWDNLYAMMRHLRLSVKESEMCKEVLRLQALCGKAYPSARYLGARAQANEKTWDRCLNYLRARGYAKTWRLHRQDGKQSVNLIDLREMWLVILALIAHNVSRAWWIGDRYMLRVGAFWMTLTDFLARYLAAATPQSSGS